jgi:hypothetical protein
MNTDETNDGHRPAASEAHAIAGRALVAKW